MKTQRMRHGMLGLRVLTAVLMIAGFMVTGARSVSAQDDESGVDGDTFTGPNFGWSVAWDDDVWEVSNEDNSGGSDFFSLSTLEDPFALAQFFGAEEFAGAPDDCAAGWEDVIAGQDGNTDVEETDEFDLPRAPRGGAATAYTYVSETDDGDLDLIQYVMCQTLVEDEAVLILTVLTVPEFFEDVVPVIEDLTAEIELPDEDRADDEEETGNQDDDEETPEADDEEEDADAEPTRDVLLGDEDEGEDEEVDEDDTTDESGVDGNVYVGPNFGWSITWDEDVWEFDDEDNSGGSDYISFLSEDPFAIAVLQGVELFDGDPDACVEEWGAVIESRDEVTDVEEASDLDTPREPRGAAGAVFTYTLELDDGDELEVAEYIQCQTLVEDEAVLELVLQVPVDGYEDALPIFEDLISEIEIEEDGGSSADDSDTEDEPEEDEPADDEEPADDADEDEEEEDTARIALRLAPVA